MGLCFVAALSRCHPMVWGKRGGLRHEWEHAITCIHISAAEPSAPMELLAARHERYSLLRYADKSKD